MKLTVSARKIMSVAVLVFLVLIGCKKPGGKVGETPDSTIATEEIRYAEITGSGVNARRGPGIGYRVEFQLAKRAKVKILDVHYPDATATDTAFVTYEWVDDGKGNFTPPYKFEDAVMSSEYKIDEYATLNKGMAVRVCFSADPGGHGWVHAEYVIEGIKDTLKLHDMPMVRFREIVQPLGTTQWYKVETENEQVGWVFGDYVKEKK